MLELDWEEVSEEGVECALGRSHQAFQPLKPYGKSHLEYEDKTKLLPSESH